MEFIYIWLIFLFGMMFGAGLALMFASKIISAMTEELKRILEGTDANQTLR